MFPIMLASFFSIFLVWIFSFMIRGTGIELEDFVVNLWCGTD